MASGYLRLRGEKWYACWKDAEGKSRSRAVSKDKAVAEQFLAAQKLKVLLSEAAGTAEVTYVQVAWQYCNEIVPLRYKHSTATSYRGIALNRLAPYFGNSPYASIGLSDVNEYLGKRLSEGLSPKTVLSELNTMRRIGEAAIAWGYAEDNPAAEARIKKDRSHKVTVLTPPQIRKLLNSAVDARAHAVIMTALLTGVRASELSGFMDKDVDFVNHKIHVRRQYIQRRYQTPKTKSSIRDIDMTPELERELDAWMRSPCRYDSPSGVLFPNCRGGAPSNCMLNSHLLKPSLESAGLPNMRFHDLRHTYASLLLANRESVKYVQAMLGHSTITTTVDTYGHLLSSSNLPAARRLDAAVFEK